MTMDVGDVAPSHDAARSDRRERLGLLAREALGFSPDGHVLSLRDGIARSGVGWYPLTSMSLLWIVTEFYTYGFFVLGPEISQSLGVSRALLAALLALKTLSVMVGSFPMAAYVQRRPRRAVLSVTTAFAWSVVTVLTAFVINSWGLAAVLIADGVATASVRAIHPPLLMDSYPPEVRTRVLAFYRGASALANILAPLLVGLLTAYLGFNWRGVFLAMGITCFIATLYSIRLRDPGFGRWDTARVREVVRKDIGATATDLRDEDVELGFFEIVGRLLLVPTLRHILTAHAVLGMLLVPLYTYLFFFLEERWNLSPGQRSVYFAVLAVFSVAALAMFGRRAEELFRRDPERLVRLSGWFLGSGVVTLALSIASPIFMGLVVLMGIAFALFTVTFPAINVVMLSIVPAPMRPHASALAGIFLAGVGGFGGLILLSGIDRRIGPAGAIISLAVPGVVAAYLLHRASRDVMVDLDRMIDAIVEEEEVDWTSSQGVAIPTLACRNLDFSYGTVQVLFDVNLRVEDGEMIALLGTNGAGKSTLLRVVSGLGLPRRGTVRYRGRDVTYLDAERRHALGMTQVPGGKAVYSSLSVLDNLRMFGYSHGRASREVNSGIDFVLEAFPQLADRRSQAAGTLSGGEQQMLALGRVYIMRPRLLLIDELSLGLAPKIVTSLLEVVRQINATGTSIIVVEQSVNVALSLVDRAYFMEKGEIRFDGSSRDLLQRHDLLRSVFLYGAAEGLDKASLDMDRD